MIGTDGPTRQPHPPTTVPLPSDLTPIKRWNRALKILWRKGGDRRKLLEVGMALSSFCSTEPSCFPGIPKIAKEAGVSLRTAGEHLRTLEAWGAISRERRPKKHKTLGGSGQYNSFLVPPGRWIWAVIRAELNLPIQRTADVAEIYDDPTIPDEHVISIGKFPLSIGNVADLCGFVNRQVASSESASFGPSESANLARKSSSGKDIPDPLQSRADAPGKYEPSSTGNSALEGPLTSGATRVRTSSTTLPASASEPTTQGEAKPRSTPLPAAVPHHDEGTHHEEVGLKPWDAMTSDEQEAELRRLEGLRSRDDGRYVPGGTFDIAAKVDVIPIGVASDALPLQCPECGGLEPNVHGYGRHRLICSKWQAREERSA